MSVRRSRIIQLIAAALSVALVATLVMQTSKAAFNAQTTNPDNSWATGTVAISDDDSGTALFSTATDGNLTGGQVLTKCIAVTYSGSDVSSVGVRMFGAATGDLAPYLDLRIREGAGGEFGDCTGFTPTGTLYTGNVDDFAATHSDFSNGVSTWSPAANPETRTYELQITVDSDAAAQGKSATGSFTWEAQG